MTGRPRRGGPARPPAARTVPRGHGHLPRTRTAAPHAPPPSPPRRPLLGLISLRICHPCRHGLSARRPRPPAARPPRAPGLRACGARGMRALTAFFSRGLRYGAGAARPGILLPRGSRALRATMAGRARARVLSGARAGPPPAPHAAASSCLRPVAPAPPGSCGRRRRRGGAEARAKRGADGKGLTSQENARSASKQAAGTRARRARGWGAGGGAGAPGRSGAGGQGQG